MNYEQIFRDNFATHIGQISAVLQNIQGIDTGHDGAEFFLSREGWEMSCFADLCDGHNGKWSIYLASRKDGVYKTLGQFEACFDAGTLTSFHKSGLWAGQ